MNPYLLLTLASLFWSLNFIIGKILAGSVPASIISTMRWIVPILVYLPFFYRELWDNRSLFLARWRLIFLLGFTGYCLNGYTVYKSVHFTSAINASFLSSFNPIIFALIAFLFYREKLSWIQAVGITLSLLGVLWIIFRGDITLLLNLQVNPGDFLMILSVTSWAAYSVVFQKYGRAFPPNSLFLLLSCSGFLINLPIALLENSIQGWDWLGQIGFYDVAALFAISLVPSLLSFTCWNTALLKVSSNQAAIFLNLIPFFTALISILFLGEKLLLPQVVGGLGIISGVILVTNGQRWQKNYKTRKLKEA